MPADWQLVKEIFTQAFSLEVEKRKAFVEDKCRGDPELRRDVDELLSADSRYADFLERGAVPVRHRFGVMDHITPEIEAGAQIDRYVIVEKLGQGGMGVVYRAYDPKLDRLVALKLLHGSVVRNQKGKASWLRREAQALAKLSHPNVVSVFDVGELDDRIFLAMELVQGQTLKAWLSKRSKTRPYFEIVGMFLAAGEGLWAAHQVGLVHRDFKPSNVMVGDDGRVRVLDFGLARSVRELVQSDDTQIDPLSRNDKSIPDTDQQIPPRSLVSQSFSATGEIAGTPGYMALEQLRGGYVDARSDQYSFCSALYEALYQVLPYEGENIDDLIANIEARRVQEKCADNKIPVWLHPVVLKGLDPDPDGRYLSMAKLLTALRDDPVRKRRKRMAIGSLIGLVVLMTVFIIWLGAIAGGIECAAPESELDTIWSRTIKRDMAKAFAASDLWFSDDTYLRVSGHIDEYMSKLRLAYVQACEDTHKYGRQSIQLLDRRIICLRRKQYQLAALTKQLSEQVDDRAVNNAIKAVLDLPDPGRCRDVEVLVEDTLLPVDPTLQERIEKLDAMLEKVEVHIKLGTYPEGLQASEYLLVQIENIDYPPLKAGALYLKGTLQEKMGDYQSAEKTLRQAIQVAAFCKNVTLLTRASLRLVWTIGIRKRDFDGAFEVLRVLDEKLLAWLHTPVDLMADYHHHRATLLAVEGRFDEAGVLFRQAVAERRQVLGDDHPAVAISLNSLGNIFSEQGKYSQAKPYYEQALMILEKVLGPKHPDVTQPLNNLGSVSYNLGDNQTALRFYRRSLKISEPVLGSDHLKIALPVYCMGECFLAQKKYKEAERMFARALKIVQSTLGSEHPDSTRPLHGLGMVSFERKKYPLARDLLQKALSIREKLLPPGHPLVTEALSGLGKTYLMMQLHRKAYKFLKRAVVLQEKTPGDVRKLADSRFALAQAILKAHGDRKKARDLALLAREGFESAKSISIHDIAQIDVWLDNLTRETP